MIPINEDSEKFIVDTIKKVENFSKSRKEPFDFYCILWLRTKYNHPEDLFNFIFKYENIWKTHSFLRRQTTAIMSRLLLYKEERVITFLNKQIATAEPNIVSVATSILNFRNIKNIETKVNMYLFPKNGYKTLPLNKFLVLCSFLNADVYRNNNNIKKQINNYIKDPYYKKWLELQYNIR